MRGFIGGLILGLVIGVMLAVAGPQTNTLVKGKKEAKGPEVEKDMGTSGSPVDWRLSGVAPDYTAFSSDARRVAARITGLTGAGVKMSYHAAGSQENSLELFNAVSFGTIEAVFSRTGNWGNKSRGFDFLAGLPFGPPGEAGTPDGRTDKSKNSGHDMKKARFARKYLAFEILHVASEKIFGIWLFWT